MTLNSGLEHDIVEKCKRYKCQPHQIGDYLIKERNEEEGRDLCDRCDGTGNELYSMYKKCTDCGGKGYKC